MMTPVIITVVGGTILTPIDAEAGISQEGKSAIQETGLVDHYDKMEQLDIVSEKLLQEDQEYMEERKD